MTTAVFEPHQYNNVPLSSATHNVLFQYFCALKSITPSLQQHYNILLLCYYVQKNNTSLLQPTAPVLQHTIAIRFLLCILKNLSETILWYKLAFCIPLSFLVTTLHYGVHFPVLLCTTNEMYFNVRLCTQRSATKNNKLLPSATAYWSETSLYYKTSSLYSKVLLRYHPVSQDTIPILLPCHN